MKKPKPKPKPKANKPDKPVEEVTPPQRPQFGTSNPERAPVASAPGKRLLGPKDLPAKGIAYHPNHLRRMWTADPPKFPPPVYTSERRFAWREEDIDRWIDERVEKPRPVEA